MPTTSHSLLLLELCVQLGDEACHSWGLAAEATIKDLEAIDECFEQTAT